jgi:hypothetical protein
MAIARSIPRLAVVLCAAPLFTAGAFAAEPTPLRAMIDESGMVEQFELIAQMYRGRLLDTGRMQGLPAEIGDGLADIGARAMASERFLDDLEAALTDSLSAEEIAVMRDFFGSPLGRKVKRVEGQASTVRQRADDESQRTKLRLELNELPKRKEQFELIDRCRLMSELSASVTTSLIYVTAVGVLTVEDGGASTDALGALDAGVAAMREALLGPTREDMGAILLQTYRRLSDNDLEVYVAFLETEQARAVYAAVLAAANGIFKAREHEIAKDFAAFVRRSKS